MKRKGNTSNRNIHRGIRNEDIFLFAYDLYILTGIIGTTLLSQYYPDIFAKGLCVFELLLLILIECRQRAWKKDETALGVLCVLLFVLFMLRAPVDQSAMFIFVFSSRRFSFKRIAEHTSRISIILLVFIVLLSQVGIVKDVIFEGYRHAVGFRYVLFGPSILLNVVMLNVYLEGRAMKWYKIALFAALDIWLLFKCYAELSFGLTLVVLLCVVYLKVRGHVKSRQNRIPKIAAYSFLILWFASFYIVHLYSSHANEMYSINRMLSGRLSLMLKAISQYPVNLFGHNIEWVGNGLDSVGQAYEGQYFYVDNAYVHVTLTFGFVASSIIWLMHTVALRNTIKRGDVVSGIIILVLSAYFLIDNLKLRLYYNSIWLLLPRFILYKYDAKPEDANQRRTTVMSSNRLNGSSTALMGNGEFDE